MTDFSIRPGSIFHVATTLGEPRENGAGTDRASNPISFQEFHEATGLPREMFDRCDIDNNGFIQTSEEMARYWECLCPK